MSRRNQIIELASRPCGVRRPELLALMGITKGTLSEYLQDLRKEGAIVPVGKTVHSRWATPESVASVRAEVAEAMRIIDQERRKRHNANRRAKGQRKVRTRIVKAPAKAPIWQRAPASVFHLGGML